MPIIDNLFCFFLCEINANKISDFSFHNFLIKLLKKFFFLKGFLVQIFQHGQFSLLPINAEICWNLQNKHFFKESLEVFIYYCTEIFQSTPHEYHFQLPGGCVACGWITQGKRPENVIISHTLLKTFTEGIN